MKTICHNFYRTIIFNASALHPTIMYSSEDLERFYFQYQTEAVPLGMSVQTFCLRNNVPYNIFHKWYKDTRKRIVRVQMDGTPPDSVSDVVSTVCPQEEKTAVTELPPASFQESSPSSSSGRHGYPRSFN